MKSEQNRYKGSARPKDAYRNEFAVECPKCSKDAIVSVDNPWYLDNGKLTCLNCLHIEKAEELIRYNILVKRNCDNCGKHFEIKIPNKKAKMSEINVPCPHCKIVRSYQPRNEKMRLIYKNSDRTCEPIFNLPLWFQLKIKGNLFWAYNRSHLAEIKKYVQAKLRERQAGFHTTMVEKLPKFITEAKNREAIIKGINKQEKK